MPSILAYAPFSLAVALIKHCINNFEELTTTHSDKAVSSASRSY